MKRWLFALGLLPLVLLLLVLYVVSTESGLRVALWPVKTFAPDLLVIKSVDGKLLGPLDISGLSLSTKELSVNVDSLSLRWSPSALFKRNLSVQKLALDGVQMTLSGESGNQNPAGNEPFKLPERLALPVSAEFVEFSVRNFSIRTTPDADPQLIDEVVAQLQYDRDGDALGTLAKVQTPLLTAQLSLDVGTRDAYPIDGHVDWIANLAGLAPVDGATTISGNVSSLQIVQKIAAPYSLEAKATLRDVLESLSIDASASLAMNSAADINTDLPAVSLVGDVTFTGEPQNGTLRSSLVFAGDLPGIINSTLEADVSRQLVTLKELAVTVDGQALALNADGTVDLSSTKPVVDFTFRWDDLQWPWTDAQTLVDASGQARLQGTPDDVMITIDSSLNETGELIGAVNLSGSDINTTLDWRSLQWPLDGSVASKISGGIKVDGRVDGYTLTIKTTADTPQLAGITIKANGAGTQKSLLLPSISLVAADGTLGGKVKVTWAPALEFDVSVDGSDFNPGVFFPDFPGDLNIAMDAEGSTVDDMLQASIEKLAIHGELRGQPLAMNAKAKVNGSEMALETLSLNAGDTALLASGTLSDQLDLTFSLASPDLSTFVPTAGGSISGKGRIVGSPTLPSINLSLAGRSLRFGDLALQSLDLDAAVDASPEGPVAIKLSMDTGTAAGVNLDSLTLVANGRMDAHTINLSGESDQGDIDLSLSGALAEKRWQYSLQTGTLAYPELAPWSLLKPAAGSVSPDTVTIRDVCLGSAEAQVCLSAEKDSQFLDARYELSRFALEILQPFLPAGTTVAGIINSAGAVLIPTAAPMQGKFNASIDSTTLDINNSDGDSVRVITLESSEISGALNSNGATLNAQLDLGEQGKLQADVVATGATDKLLDASLSGRITGSLAKLDVIEGLVPVLEDVQGSLMADFKLAGSPREPLLNGELTIADGNVSLAEPGIVISNATARISANKSSQLGVAVTALSGEGSVRVDGTVDIATTTSPTVDLTIKGEQFEVINTLEAEAALSPDLSIVYGDKGLFVSGDVSVPVLAITPKKIPAGVVSVSEDQLVVGEENEQQRATPVDIRADVKITFGDDVFIDAFGLNAALSGSLAVKEVPGNETTATGQLEIEDGTFRAYGQNLVIQKGRIIYAGGPISKPGFDIEAVRKVTSEIQVGIRARGALENPQFSLFSDPPMSESEQMSYLVLGRPLQDNSPSENSAMRQAAMALGVAGGKLLTEKFGDKLGLDQVAIDSELRESGEQAALVVGKYLSPKLFVSYGIGLFEPVSTLKLDYSINRNIKLISETTESKSGGDIVFTFEGGK